MIVIMKLSDIDLSNIKLAVFDFDDTLAIHKDRDFMKKHFEAGEENRISYYADAYADPDRFYDETEPCEASETLYALVALLRKKGIKMYCLSGMKFSFHLKAKQRFIDRHYGKGIEVITSASQEHKLQGVKVLQKINNCRPEEILFVDDRQYVLDLLAQYGIKVILADDIVL